MRCGDVLQQGVPEGRMANTQVSRCYLKFHCPYTFQLTLARADQVPVPHVRHPVRFRGRNGLPYTPVAHRRNQDMGPYTRRGAEGDRDYDRARAQGPPGQDHRRRAPRSHFQRRRVVPLQYIS